MAHHRVGLARELCNSGEQEVDASRFMDELEAFATGRSDIPERATARERALLAYAVVLTMSPARISVAAVERMRQVGLDDGAILEANQVVAYFAYVNRVVDGLGVQLEPFMRSQ